MQAMSCSDARLSGGCVQICVIKAAFEGWLHVRFGGVFSVPVAPWA